MKPLSYLEIARHALEHKEHDLFKLAAKNRQRVLQKEMASARTLTTEKNHSEMIHQ